MSDSESDEDFVDLTQEDDDERPKPKPAKKPAAAPKAKAKAPPKKKAATKACLLYTSPSPRDQRGSRMPSSA